jgi:hypothetical protein
MEEHHLQKTERSYSHYIGGVFTPIFEEYSDRIDSEMLSSENWGHSNEDRIENESSINEADTSSEYLQPESNWGLQPSPEIESDSHLPISEDVEYSAAGISQFDRGNPKKEPPENFNHLVKSSHEVRERKNSIDVGSIGLARMNRSSCWIQKDKDQEFATNEKQVLAESPKMRSLRDRFEFRPSQKLVDERVQQPKLDDREMRTSDQIGNKIMDQKNDQPFSRSEAVVPEAVEPEFESDESDVIAETIPDTIPNTIDEIVVETTPEKIQTEEEEVDIVEAYFDAELKSKKEARIKLRSKWETKHAQRGELRVPKIRLTQHKRIRRGLKKLIEEKLVPIIEESAPLDQSEEEHDFFNTSFKHVIYKLQRHIVKKLKVQEFQRKSKKNQPRGESKEMPRDLKGRMFELDHQESKTTTLAGKLRALYNAYQQHEHDVARANVIATLEMDAVSIAQTLDPEIITHTLGHADVESIRRVVRNADNDMENKLEWIHFYLFEKETEIRNEWAKRKAVQMQNLYMDDPKRAFKWLTDDTQPDIPISIHTLKSHFSKIWEHKPQFSEPDEQSLWKLHKVISDEEIKIIAQEVESEEAMIEVIQTRGNASAPGEDGLTNPILKIQAKSMAQLLVMMLKKVIEAKRCPEIWKSSRTILLYKKGDREDPGNWRPISLTSVLYRAIMARFSKALFKIHERVPIVSLNQKGFVPGISGCAEHAARANSVIHHANLHHRSIFIVALDLKDAFGSIPHQLIKRNMIDIGLPGDLCEFVCDCYHKSSTRIFAGKSRTDPIRTNKGVKQGCPLSPLLFDLAIDPLLKSVETLHQGDGYKMQVGNQLLSTIIQAYADDILLFSENKEGMDSILETVGQFCKYANIQLNPKKCKSFYKCGRDDDEGIAPERITIDGEELEYVKIDEVIEYLGTPIGARKNAKLNFAESKVENFRKYLRRIMQSGLKISQKINAIKTFIAPQLDFYLMNGQIRVSDLKELDVEVRRVINEALKGPRLPIDYYYTSWKDGGASLVCLEERKEVMTITNLAHLLGSQDDLTRKWIQNDINEEVITRKIITNDLPQRFLDWEENDFVQLEATGRRFDSLIFRAYKASKKLKVGVQYIEEERKIQIVDFRDRIISSPSEDTSEDETENEIDEVEPNKYLSKPKQTASSLMRLLQVRHRKKLQSLALRGHSFRSLQQSRYSNFFIGHCKAPTSDAIVKFAMRARTNSLPTKAILLKAGKTHNGNCAMCGHLETLNHILNGCRHRLQKMTDRHNMICNILVEAVLKHFQSPTIKQNSRIKPIGKRVELPEDSKILKPDIWFEKDDVIYIIEVTVPYAMQTTRFPARNIEDDDDDNERNVPDPEELSTLEVRRREKVRKYSKLKEDCSRVFNMECKLFVVVVSSLGAVPKETEVTLNKMLKCQPRTLSLWLKRMSIAAIRGSMLIFYNMKYRRSERRVPTALDQEEFSDEEEDEPGEENCLQDRLHEQVLLEVDDHPEEEDDGQEAKEVVPDFQIDVELNRAEVITQQQEVQISEDEIVQGLDDNFDQVVQPDENQVENSLFRPGLNQESSESDLHDFS